MDEFRITASRLNHPDRIWTRSKLPVATFIADKAVRDLGYDKAVVINTFGGHMSAPLYVAEKFQ